MTEKIIQRGAEAVIILKDNKIIKKRVKKSYRIDKIDEKIRKLRTRSEAKMIEKASKLIPIPKVIQVNEKTKEITLEFIQGKKLSENLSNFSNKLQKEICNKIGINVSKIHDSNLIHGDLTTSNMIYVENNNLNKKLIDFQVYFIDFGLGFFSSKIEDKAVDLHLLKEALEAKHFENKEKLFNSILEGYSISKESAKVLEQLKKVESRGRYKEKY